MRRLALVPLLLAVAALAGAAEDTREVSLPREGFSLRVPASWTVTQYRDQGGLRVAQGKASLDVAYQETLKPEKLDKWAPEFEAFPVPGALDAWRTVAKVGDAWTAVAFVHLPDGRLYKVQGDGRQDDAEGQAAVTSALASLDFSPFPNPRAHVDWLHGFTVEVPEGWTLEKGADRARFVAPNGRSVLAVDAWDDLPLAHNQRGIQGLDAFVELGVRTALDEKVAGEAIVEHDDPEVAEIGIGDGIDGRLAGLRIQTASQKATGKHGFLLVLVTSRYRLLAIAADEGSAEAKAGSEALKTFAADTVAARRAPAAEPKPAPAAPTEAPPTDRFAREDAPKVVFRLPEGWKSNPGTNQMRLAQIEVPGDPPAEFVVFFFGEGGGGGVQANLDRWKGQMHGEEAKSEVVEVAEGIKASLLDVSGVYASDMGGAHGGEGALHDSRLLAAVIECPGGPLFVKGVGPKATMDAAEASFRAWIRSFRKA